jgi:hypothetical protein
MSALNRSWSLAEVMQRFESAAVTSALNKLSMLSQLIESHPPFVPDLKLGREDYEEHLLPFIDILLAESKRMKLRLVIKSVQKLKDNVEKRATVHPDFVSIPTFYAKGIKFFLDDVRERFNDEIATLHCFFLSDDERSYHDPSKPLFGAEVDNAFPSSSPEIEEAGKCRATGRWTACVMHLMRALEPALLALQATVGVNVPKEQWNQIIDQIESKIEEIKKRTHGGADEQWYSEAATHFRFIKNAWRNYAQHLHERYDEERALEIYDSVRAFMRQLATRLSE